MKNIYRIFILLIFNSAFSIHNSFSQTAPGIEWQNTIGGSGGDKLYSIQQTTDGGFILGGHSNSNISGDKTEDCIGFDDYWIVKTDSLGNIQWQNTIGGNDYEELHYIKQTTDGGFILGGNSLSNISGDKTENSWNNSNDYWLVKTDFAGSIQWENTIGGISLDRLYSIHQTADGGYIAGGYSLSNISGDKTENTWSNSKDFWIVKINASGGIQWQNTIGGGNDDELHSIQQTADGGYILGGFSFSNISGDKTENNWDPTLGTCDYWIVKIDPIGTIQWQNTIGGGTFDWLSIIQQTSDGGYILGGLSNSNISGDKTENCWGNSSDYWIVKTDASGNIQWQNTIGGNDYDGLTSIQQTADNGYVLGGFSTSNISGDKTENSNGQDDYWIVKTDSMGNIQWQNTIGGIGGDVLRSMQQTVDGGYILGGYSYSNISGDKTENSMGQTDYWIVKLFPDTITGIPNYQLPNYPITISPNPAREFTVISYPFSAGDEIRLTDVSGRILFTKTFSSPASDFRLLTSAFSPIVYLFSIINKETGERMNSKIVVE